MNVSHRFVVIAAIFVTCLITANIIAVKPITLGVNFLKKKEAIDTYDYETNFNPFLASD